MQIKPDKLRVASLILNDNGELLVIRVKGRDIWTSLGGGIEENESGVEAIVREIKEEVGLEAIDVQEYTETSVEKAAGTENKTVKVIFYLVKSWGSIQINPEEDIADFKWISANQYREMGEQIASGLREYAIPKLIKEGRMR